MMSARLSQILFFLALAFSVNADCRGKTSIIKNGKEYRLFFEKKTNFEAMKACERWGKVWKSPSPSYLIQNIDNSLQTCVKEMILTRQKDFSTTEKNLGFHLGGVMKNGWYWNHGNKINNINSHWAPNQPRHFSGQKRCMIAAMWQRDGIEVGHWIDQPCVARNFYICEREVNESFVWGFSKNTHAVTPENWNQLPGSEVCGGPGPQSPQDLPLMTAEFCNDPTQRKDLYWATDNGQTVQWKVKNTGRMIEIRFDPPRTLYTTFGTNGTKHYIDYMNLKWGSSRTNGAEHTVRGLRHAGELQIFHYPNQDGKRHAIAFLLEERYVQRNRLWDDLIQHMYNIPEASSVTIMKSPLEHIKTLLKDSASRRSGVTPRFITDVALRYQGSLTHPPCTENIIWTVYPRPIPLSRSQFNVFRNLHMEGSERGYFRRLTETTRPTQARISPHCVL